jgi:hypothetical protein
MALHPENVALGAIMRYWRTPRCDSLGLGCVLSRGVRVRQIGLIGSKILAARGYRDGG